MTIDQIQKLRMCPLKEVDLFGGALAETAFLKLLTKQSTFEIEPITAQDMYGMPRTLCYELTAKLTLATSDMETVLPALAGQENARLRQAVFYFDGSALYNGAAGFIRLDVHETNQQADIAYSLKVTGSDLYPEVTITIKAILPPSGVASMVIIQVFDNQS